ncbi:Uncharacterised protein [Salmonella enterica subsp. enterica]|uniref:Uncharacterized protein n=1 Tax=Salmonella enterica I TaxID=59201 RepID=A0A379WGF8_SALET|nr:Uncharacterised protein [Salmonella enterica subsp. enterica]
MKRVLTALAAALPFAAHARMPLAARLNASPPLAGDYHVFDFRRVYARYYLLGL